jgi:outer membrane protein
MSRTGIRPRPRSAFMKPVRLAAFAVIMTFPAALLPAAELTLDEVLAMARVHSYSLRRTDLEFGASSAALEQARAERLPEFTLRATSTYLTNPPEGLSIKPGDLGYVSDPGSTYPTPVPETETVLVPDPEHTYFQLQANTIWPIFTWGKLEAAEKIAEMDVAVAGVSAERADADLIRDVSGAYFGLRLALESERVLREVRSVYQEIVVDRERAFDAGAVNLESVLDARSQMQGMETQWAFAAEARRSAEAGLQFLLGSAGRVVPVDGWREIVPPLDAQEITDRARRWDPNLRTLDLRIGQATTFAQIQESSEIFRPDLALFVGLEASGQRMPLSANWRESWDLGLTVTLVADAVAWDWGKRDAATREASLSAQIATIGRDELLASIEVQVTRLIETAVGVAAGLEEKRASVTLAIEREKNARVSFENELITREQHLGARVLRLIAELEAAVAGYAVESALLDLEHLSGGSLP